MQRTALVIGSGIAGASTFFALARRGVDVQLIDDGATGQASAASAGIIQPWSTRAQGAFYDVYAAGAAYYPELLSQLAEVGVTSTDYRRNGGLIVNRDRGALDEVVEVLETRRADAAEVMGQVRRLDAAQAQALFPPLAEGLEAVWVEGGGRVDGRTLCAALVEAGTRLGGTVRTGTARLTPEHTVLVDDQPALADAVVIAAGAWSQRLLEPVGVAIPVHPQRGQITHLQLAGVDTASWPTVHPMSHHYLVAFDEGRVAVGATREDGTGFDPRVTAAGQLQVLQDALGVAPGLAQATLVETRVGLRPLPEGTLPVVGALPRAEHIIVATGYGAGGLTMGPVLGDAVARRICAEPESLIGRCQPPAAR